MDPLRREDPRDTGKARASLLELPKTVEGQKPGQDWAVSPPPRLRSSTQEPAPLCLGILPPQFSRPPCGPFLAIVGFPYQFKPLRTALPCPRPPRQSKRDLGAEAETD